MAGIVTVGLAVDITRKRARWQYPVALGEVVDLELTGVDGTTLGGLVLTLRDPAPPVAARGQTTPAAGHAVAACAVWSEGEAGLHGVLDLRTAEMVRAFMEQPAARSLEYALRNLDDGELLAAGIVTVHNNPDYVAAPDAAPTLASGLERDFVTGGDAHAHDGAPTARISHYHLENAGTLTHAQLEADLAAAEADAAAAVHSALEVGREAAAATATAAEALATANTAQSTANAAATDAHQAGQTAGAAETLVESLAGTIEDQDAANLSAHAAIAGRLDALEAIRAPSVDGRIAVLEAQVEALQALTAQLLWRSTRIPDAEGEQWARVYAVEAAGRVALGPLGALEDEP